MSVESICTCAYLTCIYAMLIPMCTDVAISVPDKTVNFPLGCAGCPHVGLHHKQMGGNWNGCMQMLQRNKMDSSHQVYIGTDRGIVCL